MRWGTGTFRFARPIHWVVALLGAYTLPFEVDGIRSGHMTRGHRFRAPGEAPVPEPRAYTSVLRDRFVIADPDERKKIIRDTVGDMARGAGGRVVEDQELLETVANLVEYPVPMLGQFEAKYLALPRELLVTVMKGHQKYFAVENDKGDLLPFFITVSNSSSENVRNVVAGNERVLRARLEDARFYFEDDLKVPLASRVDALKGITYQVKLGTVHDKVRRMTEIGLRIQDRLGLAGAGDVRQACELAKADLTTGVVYEFPELQGYMGMTYARHNSLDEGVARAVYEHYMPRFSGDDIPSSDLGAVASLADKVDSVVSFFSVGLIPTGSEDPFALRRQSLGLLAILDGRRYEVAPSELVDMALSVLSASRPVEPDVRGKVLEFIGQRLQVVLTAEGHRQDDVAAVLATDYTSLRDVRLRLEALASLRKSPTFSELVTGSKRVYNILSKNRIAEPVQESLLAEPAERTLFDTVHTLGGIHPGQPERLNDLVTPINTFFDQVLVMDKDENLKRNRLALLESVRAIFGKIADFSKLLD